jgi:hypothetical protein
LRHEHRIHPHLQGQNAQNLNLQYDALTDAGVAKEAIYEDRASGKKGKTTVPVSLHVLRHYTKAQGDTLVV